MRGPSLSPDLLGLGVLFIVAGLAVDFAMSTAADTWRGRCRVVVVPRRGRALCVGALDPPRADALLAALVERTREPEPAPPDAPSAAVTA
jgi:hypothetical protein